MKIKKPIGNLAVIVDRGNTYSCPDDHIYRVQVINVDGRWAYIFDLFLCVEDVL